MIQNREICMEATHGRKSKCKTEFKAVLNKVIVSSIVLATIVGTTTPAFAADSKVTTNYKVSDVQIYGLSVEESIQEIKNTIATIQEMKNNGAVSMDVLKTLANQLYSLESAVKTSETGVTTEVRTIIENAEKAINNLSNANDVKVALAVVKADLGIDSMTSVQYASSNQLKSFRDVPTNHWAYKAIMRSVELGLIAGTKAPDANGVGEFNPNANMTRAQFIVVTMRAVAPDVLNELNNAGQGETWYSNATQLAVQLGILEWTDFGGLSETANMNKAITREEMAHILSNATSVLGQTPSSKISTSRITDWSKVSSEYQLDVINAYSLGMLTGYANPGNFGPKDNMSRAQACAVLNRLLDVDSRANVDTSTPTQKPSESNNQSSYIGATIKGQTTEAQTWKEGEKHSVPKVGDTIIAKNGTKYTIQATYVDGRCILGFGIPCDIWTGTVAPDGSILKRGNWSGWWGDDYSSMLRNTATGEVHTRVEWSALRDSDLINRPTQDGTYNGQVSGYYIWEVYQGAFGTEAGWSFKTESK